MLVDFCYNFVVMFFVFFSVLRLLSLCFNPCQIPAQCMDIQILV